MSVFQGSVHFGQRLFDYLKDHLQNGRLLETAQPY